MSALRRAGILLRSVYRLLVEPQPLADLCDQAAHEMILRPRSRFANRHTPNPDLETPADTNGDNVHELKDAASDGSLSDTQALSVTVTDMAEQPRDHLQRRRYYGGAVGAREPGGRREGVRPNWLQWCARRPAPSPGSATTLVRRLGIAEIDAESGAVFGWDSIPGRVHGLTAIVVRLAVRGLVRRLRAVVRRARGTARREGMPGCR